MISSGYQPPSAKVATQPRGRISGDVYERAIDGGEQIEGGGRIITRRLGQRVDKDHV